MKPLTDLEDHGLAIAWRLLERENFVGAHDAADERAVRAAMGFIFHVRQVNAERRKREKTHRGKVRSGRGG